MERTEVKGGKILYLSWSVPPDTSGSAIIALNLVQQFTREEMVMAGEKPYGKPPVRWKPEWPELCYVQHVWPITGRGQWMWRVAQFPWMICRCLWLIWKHRVDRIVAGLSSGSVPLCRIRAVTSDGLQVLRLSAQLLLQPHRAALAVLALGA